MENLLATKRYRYPFIYLYYLKCIVNIKKISNNIWMSDECSNNLRMERKKTYLKVRGKMRFKCNNTAYISVLFSFYLYTTILSVSLYCHCKKWISINTLYTQWTYICKYDFDFFWYVDFDVSWIPWLLLEVFSI